MARLVVILRSDPASAISAALEGWDYPIDRTTLAVLDLHDRFVEANADQKQGRPKPHPARPFKIDDRRRKQIGDTGGRSREEIAEILRGLGHNIPV